MWVSEDRRSKQRTFVGIMVVAAIVFILMLVLWFPRDEGGNGNVDGRQGPWNDLDNFKRSVSAVEFFNYYEVNGARELVDITTPKESVYLLVGLERPVNSSELVQMAEYLENGDISLLRTTVPKHRGSRTTYSEGQAGR